MALLLTERPVPDQDDPLNTMFVITDDEVGLDLRFPASRIQSAHAMLDFLRVLDVLTYDGVVKAINAQKIPVIEGRSVCS